MDYSWGHAYDIVIGGAITLAVKISHSQWQRWQKRRLPYENGRREEILRSYRELWRRNPEMAADLVVDIVTDFQRKSMEEQEFNRKVSQRLRTIGMGRED